MTKIVIFATSLILLFFSHTFSVACSRGNPSRLGSRAYVALYDFQNQTFYNRSCLLNQPGPWVKGSQTIRVIVLFSSDSVTIANNGEQLILITFI